MGRDKNSAHNPNANICRILIEMAEYERNINDNMFKYNAYRRAANTLAKQSNRIESGEESDELPGIGKSISSTINEYLKTGTVRKLEKMRKNPKHKAIMQLMEISGIGPVKARKLVETGIMSIEELKHHPEKLNRQQTIGLKYIEDFKKKIPREEIDLIKRKVKAEALKLDKYYHITICGSYRRGNKLSGDVDILLTHQKYTSKSESPENYLRNIIFALRNQNFITDVMSLGTVKFMGVCKIQKTMRRIDVRLTPYDEYYFSVLYYTGNDIFNMKMRYHALKNGFTLNEYGLRRVYSDGKVGSQITAKNEREIFHLINYPYIKPKHRNW